MAAAWFNALVDPEKAHAISAGTQPGASVHPEVRGAMSELGIQLDGIAPQFLSDDLARSASMLITMGCGEVCPVVPGLTRLDWPLEDPKGKSIERVREIRDDVRARVVDLLTSQSWQRPLVISPAGAGDRDAVNRLLSSAGLSVDLGDFFPTGYAIARAGEEIVGCAGLEEHAGGSLLRSVAVNPAWRALALGRRLIANRLETATTDVYLLTIDAAEYFRRLGFEECARSNVPPGVSASTQFSGVTCRSATCLVRRAPR